MSTQEDMESSNLHIASNPTGLYRYEFTLNAEQGDLCSKTFIVFEGVDAAFHIWINDRCVGYSQDSKMTCEFDISDFIKTGKNTLVVSVYRWCDGSYLEDQDQWWLSGIFRDVYTYRKSNSHISDYTIHTDCLDKKTSTWSVKLTIAICETAAAYFATPDHNVRVRLLDQDFNEVQRELISRCVNGGRCIIVGDKNQAIYGFRGADSNSIEMFRQRLQKGEREISEFPLSITWRCPKSVVSEANRYVKEFSAPDFAIDGSVIENAPFNPQRNDMVLCRYNAPLVSAFYDLISQGKSAYVLGRDMTKGLITAVQKVSKNNYMGVDEFWQLFMQDYDYNYNRLMNLNKENQAMALEDKKDCIHIFVQKPQLLAVSLKKLKEYSMVMMREKLCYPLFTRLKVLKQTMFIFSQLSECLIHTVVWKRTTFAM